MIWSKEESVIPSRRFEILQPSGATGERSVVVTMRGEEGVAPGLTDLPAKKSKLKKIDLHSL